MDEYIRLIKLLKKKKKFEYKPRYKYNKLLKVITRRRNRYKYLYFRRKYKKADYSLYKKNQNKLKWEKIKKKEI
jgi:hypothetical protein